MESRWSRKAWVSNTLLSAIVVMIEFEQYRNRMYGLALKLLRNREEAEDVVQESMCKAYNHRAKIPFIRNMASWLLTITYRTALDRVGRLRGEEHLNFEAFTSGNVHEFNVVDKNPNPEEIFFGGLVSEELEHILNSVSERDRKILELAADHTYEEIGDILKCPMGSVKSRLFRAREAARKVSPRTPFAGVV